MVERDPTVNRAILDGMSPHLEGLKKTADGAVLYGLIARSLQRYVQEGEVDLAFIGVLNAILRNYTRDPQADPATRFKARLIRQRLRLDLPVFTGDADRPHRLIRLVPAGGLNMNTGSRAEQPAEGAPQSAAAVRAERPGEDGARAGTDHGGIQGMDGLREDLEQLLREHQQLGANLHRAHHYLTAIESDRSHLESQLRESQAHLLVDVASGLPNKTAFMRQLGSEIARSHRHASPLAVALVALDQIKGEGREPRAGTTREIMSRCAAGIAAQLRIYDVVARYDEHLFSLLLPGTHESGALVAVEKVRRHLVASCAAGVPGVASTFSAVVASLLPGETGLPLLRRLETGLDDSQRRAADRVTVLPRPAG